jgi:carbamoyltransferase
MTYRLYQLIKENESIINCSYSQVIDLIQQKHLVALFQGRSEAGPRALGNRTLMFDPTVPNGKDLVNLIKRREWFRPFAASCLLEHVHDWFDMAGLKESPFMMYAVNALSGVMEKVPSVIHIDNTCRVQTVTKKQNLHWYNLIEEFYIRTSVPMLFNTSFNLAGDPLVETIEDALDTLRRSEIEYLYLPEIGKLVKVSN